MSIHGFKEKIKDHAGSEKAKDFFIVGIIVLASTFSFGLGRLSVAENKDSVKVQYDPSMLTASVGSLNTSSSKTTSNTAFGAGDRVIGGGSYFASKRGKKYYPVDCSAGQTIVEANKIFFSTSADAEKAGYTLSTSCK